ncbi:MAG: hypothetical protein F6K65_27365 [Moorea sp. SIO3C2]|nr:hypothetical protein [Moorena sp. SIO3C2]
MPVLPRCQFYQDASSTKMPILQVRPKAASNPSRPLRRAATLKIIPLFSNADFREFQKPLH